MGSICPPESLRLAWAVTAAFYKMSEVMFRLSEAIVLGIPQAVAFISRQIVDAIVYSFLLLVTLGVLFVAIVFREPPRL